ncbi:aminotransferase class I/II-fold pyridoxal phosphate-dependent enzyme [Microbacterium sp.]|uniref:MalY/PatB family protein n=1 Tax=Microbacterium sp. TaxID=51671 RepID=UPI00334050A2
MAGIDLTERFDAITEEGLRAIGGLKWSAYPEATGAFVAEMDFGAAEPVLDAVRSAVDVALFGYPPARLAERMQQATAAWQRDRYGWDVPAERVRPMPDVLQALVATIELFTAPGSAVVLPTPAYMPFLTVPAMLGREVVQVPMREDASGWHLDLAGIDRALAAGGGLLVFCNPHNPIGKVYSPEEMRAVAEVVERHGARVFSDEIHSPLVYAGHRHTPYATVSEAAARHTVTATAASKAWNLPGLKCAQLIFSQDEDAALWDASASGPFAQHGATNLGLIATAAAYDEARDWLDGVVDYLDGNRRLLAELVAERLPGVRFRQPDGTYLAWLDFRGTGVDDPAAFFLAHAGVAATDGGLCGEVGAGCLRFNFATSRPILRDALDRMGRAFAAR